jgi:hypothetical protein
MPKYKRTPEAMGKELCRDWDDNEAQYERTKKVIIERARRYLYSLLKSRKWTFVTGSKLATRIQTNLTQAEYNSLLQITLMAQYPDERNCWEMKILNPHILHDGKFRGWDYTGELFCCVDGWNSQYFITLTEDNKKIKEFIGHIPEETKNAKV